jgi:GT2 family glycosyltransferase
VSASPLDPAGDVSVVVVAYRTPERLLECLASFEAQLPQRVHEVIVIDHSALPEQEPPAGQFPWITYEANEANVHFRRGANQGVSRARCRYVMVLNPDTRLLAGDTIARLAEVLDAQPQIGLVGPRLPGADGRDAPQGESRAGLGYLVVYKLHLAALWPGNPPGRPTGSSWLRYSRFWGSWKA